MEAPTEQAKENTTERESAEQRAVSTEVANETTFEGDPNAIKQRREELPSVALRECSPLEATVEWHERQWERQSARTKLGFYYEDGLLYWKWRPDGLAERDVRTCKQLVLTQQC